MSKCREYIKWNGTNIDVCFDYVPGDPGVWTYPNSDPGYPATPPEFIINKVYYKGVEVTELFGNDDFETMELELYNIHNDRYEDI